MSFCFVLPSGYIIQDGSCNATNEEIGDECNADGYQVGKKIPMHIGKAFQHFLVEVQAHEAIVPKYNKGEELILRLNNTKQTVRYIY